MPATETESGATSPDDQPSYPMPERCVVVARAVLEQGRYSWLWIVRDCPYCGKQHDHFAGPLDGDPQQYSGNVMAARCDRTDRRRLAIEYPSGALWYQLETSQDDVPSEPEQHARTRGEPGSV